MNRKDGNLSLVRSAGVEQDIESNPVPETAWIEVIRKMESVYADLVNTQVEVERKNAALEDAHQFIRSVLRSMTDVLIVCDLESRVQQVNRALEEVTGRSKAGLLGAPLQELFDEESHERVEAIADSKFSVDSEVSLLGRDGERVLLSVNSSNHFDSDGSLVGNVLIGRPIGELRKAYEALNETHEALKHTQAQLVHSEKMASLGRLVAGVAHELNNPISFVFGNMRALQSYGENLQRYVGAIEAGGQSAALGKLRDELKIQRILDDMDSLIDGSIEGAERVRDIVSDLRRYSTPQSEAVSAFDLTEVIEKAVHWVIKACRNKPDIDFNLPAELPMSGRKGNVHQVLVNLVQNAMDVMEDQDEPRLQVGCVVDREFARIMVRDFGPGLSEEGLRRLFDPFYTTKPVGKGTGLGLSISYGLAIDLGGALEAGNHTEGGAVMTFSVPIDARDAQDLG